MDIYFSGVNKLRDFQSKIFEEENDLASKLEIYHTHDYNPSITTRKEYKNQRQKMNNYLLLKRYFKNCKNCNNFVDMAVIYFEFACLNFYLIEYSKNKAIKSEIKILHSKISE